jgi:hypothetical protein
MRGITENDVWKAADALLLEGARPTIERVRLKIGRGSPNTVSPFLETWFRHLGGRIKDPGAFAAPPGVPDPVLQAARHFWESALAETRRDFDARLHEAMVAAVANVEAEKERAANAEAAAFEAAARVGRAETDLAERGELLEQERLLRAGDLARFEEVRRHLEAVEARVGMAEGEIGRARGEARREVDAAQERAAAAELRAASQVDIERAARGKAEARQEALERQLTATREAGLAEREKNLELGARQRAELARLSEEQGRLTNARDAALTEIRALKMQLAEAERRADAAQSELLAMRRLVDRFNLASRPAARGRKTTSQDRTP